MQRHKRGGAWAVLAVAPGADYEELFGFIEGLELGDG